uniref:Reverse transcriptase domain-containing protein n=1 Tax=Magallana gigas TaxID=29159 RepID=A0A8W8JN00_MAGGI
MLRNSQCEGIHITEQISDITALLFADDLLMISDTVNGLQKKLNVLQKYSLKWNLSVNMDKSKVVVFKRGGAIAGTEKWMFNGKPMDVESYYKYLGTTFSCRLKWTQCCKLLALQARKALNMLKHSLKILNNRDPKVCFKLFDSIIVPILTYGAEVWGTDINEEIEAVQNDFCKWILGISKKATNIMARGECGRLPLYVIYMIKPVKYWLKIQNMETTRYPRQCFEMLYNLDLCSNRSTPNWVSKLKSVLNHYGFGDVWLSGGPGDPKVFMSELNQSVRDCALQDWNSKLDNSPKCAFYVMFKKQLTCESYLTFLSYPLKQALASFSDKRRRMIEVSEFNLEKSKTATFVYRFKFIQYMTMA